MTEGRFGRRGVLAALVGLFDPRDSSGGSNSKPAP
ncbi:hypothetical protein ABH935_000147 [Catenulispora sp. GAS73]